MPGTLFLAEVKPPGLCDEPETCVSCLLSLSASTPQAHGLLSLVQITGLGSAGTPSLCQDIQVDTQGVTARRADGHPAVCAGRRRHRPAAGTPGEALPR